MNLHLEYPVFLLFIPLGLVVVFKLVRQKSGIGFSSTTLLKGIGAGLPLLLAERLCLSVFVVAASLILARPTQLIRNTVPIYSQARDITLILDISGSMTGDNINAATSVITEFVVGRPQDRIALFVFNTAAFLEWPLSLDHETLVYRLDHADVHGGTRIAAGVIAALKHQQDYGKNPGAIIVVSDGGSDVTPQEKGAIETNLGQTQLYWIWISEKGAEDDKQAQEFALYVTSIHGKVYRGGTSDLAEIFREINQLETSPVLLEQHITSVYNFGLLPLVALVSLLLAGVMNTIREI